MSQPREMSGALFRNDKGENDRRPDYRGDLTIAGTTYRLAGWVKEDRNGKKFLALKASDEQPRPERDEKPSQAALPNRANDLNDEIPF